jgi:alpha-tubulin suppressor-like RCC1 family protein
MKYISGYAMLMIVFVSLSPTGNDFVDISSNIVRSCAIRQDGSIACWGLNDYGEATPPAGDDFVSVSCGTYHTCALKKDNTVVCWGNNDYGQCDPPY